MWLVVANRLPGLGLALQISIVSATSQVKIIKDYFQHRPRGSKGDQMKRQIYFGVGPSTKLKAFWLSVQTTLQAHHIPLSWLGTEYHETTSGSIRGSQVENGSTGFLRMYGSLGSA